MNNSNGSALLARVKSGDLVTIRREDGGTATYRAIVTHTGRYIARDARNAEFAITADNIVSIAPAMRAGG